MLKLSHYRGQSEFGVHALPLFGKADAVFEKTAAAELLPEVSEYIKTLQPRSDSQYVLVNAMGAGEYYGSNVNGDYFTEASLVHAPDDWSGSPTIDKLRAADWAYGYPTFYNAHPYAHHRNKDKTRAFGEVELAAWNPLMKRVELVTRLDKDRCAKFGGQGVWDKIKSGGFPDVSMGTKVPFDTCSVCLDWAAYERALETFDPVRHKSPGVAVLEVHKRTPIRGLSITRADYCSHALQQMSKIFPDGRKVFVYNDFPSFFDISFVFIGADRTAKQMLLIGLGVPHSVLRPSAELADEAGLEESADDVSDGEKTASLADLLLKEAFGIKRAQLKGAEINKAVIPSQFAGKAVPLLTRCEPDLPDATLDQLSTLPSDHVLSTLGGMGILLRPREFQRLSLLQNGERELADDLDDNNEVFEQSNERAPSGVSAEKFLPILADLLSPFFAQRSSLAPEIEHRVALASSSGDPKTACVPSHSKERLDKIAAAYNGYRQDVMELVAQSPQLLSKTGTFGSLQKLASPTRGGMLSSLSQAYLETAYADEYGSLTGGRRRGGGLPSREHAELR